MVFILHIHVSVQVYRGIHCIQMNPGNRNVYSDILKQHTAYYRKSLQLSVHRRESNVVLLQGRHDAH